MFLLFPRLLLRPTPQGVAQGRAIFQERLRQFHSGAWVELLADAQAQAAADAARGPRARTCYLAAAEAKVRVGEVTLPGLAPGTQDTLQQLTDPVLRPPALTAPLPEGLHILAPAVLLELDRARLASALRSAGHGSAADLSGTRYEHLRVLLESDTTWHKLVDMLQSFARGAVPDEIAAALLMGRLTALRKSKGRARGIVDGAVVRRLVGRGLVQQVALALEQATAPFLFALKTRVGTDVLALALRLLMSKTPTR